MDKIEDLPKKVLDLYELSKKTVQAQENSFCFVWTDNGVCSVLEDRSQLEDVVQVMRLSRNVGAAAFWSEGYADTLHKLLPHDLDTPQKKNDWIENKRAETIRQYGPMMADWPMDLRCEIHMLIFVQKGLKVLVSAPFSRASGKVEWLEPVDIMRTDDGGMIGGGVLTALRLLL